MSDVALRQVQKKLEKEKTELEWKLKEYGWRLDQASAVRKCIMHWETVLGVKKKTFYRLCAEQKKRRKLF